VTSALVALLVADARSAWNRARLGRLPWLRLVAARLLAVLVTVAALAAGTMAALTGASTVQALGPAVDSIVVLVLLRGLPGLSLRFFTDPTLVRLLAAPVPRAQVFAARFVTACVSVSGMTAWAAAYAAGLGARRGLGAALVAPALAAAALTTVETVAAAIAVLSVASRLSRTGRAIWAAAVLAGLAGLLVALRDGGPWWLPLSWPVHAAAARGGTGLALWTASVGSAAALVGAAWAAYQAPLGRGLANVWTEPPPVASRAAAREGLARPVWALIQKDLVLLRRDHRSLATLLPAFGLAAAYPLLAQPAGAAAADWFWLEVAAAAFLPYLLSSITALPAVAAEGQRLGLLLGAGVPPWVIVRAKLALAVPCVIVLTLAAVSALALRHGTRPGLLLAACALAAWWSAGMAAIAVGAGAAAPDPREAGRVTALGVALNAAAASGFGLLGVVALAAVLVAPRRPPFAGVAVAAMIASVALVGATLWLGVRRLGAWRPR